MYLALIISNADYSSKRVIIRKLDKIRLPMTIIVIELGALVQGNIYQTLPRFLNPTDAELALYPYANRYN